MDRVTDGDGRVVPDRTDVQVHLVGGSPSLFVSGRPVAWFENWITNGPDPTGLGLNLTAVALDAMTHPDLRAWAGVADRA